MLTVNNKMQYENRGFLFFRVVLDTKAGRTERIEPSPANYQSDALPLDYARRRKALAIRAVPSHLRGVGERPFLSSPSASASKTAEGSLGSDHRILLSIAGIGGFARAPQALRRQPWNKTYISYHENV